MVSPERFKNQVRRQLVADTEPRSCLGQGRRRRAGVSLGTVSNVLNRPERVSAATRERVERAMAELGFVRNESARQLRAGTSRTLAYVMLDAGNPFFTDVAQGIEIAAEAVDLSLVLCNSGSAPSARPRTSTCSSSSGSRGSWSPRSTPRPPMLDEIARPRHARRDRRPHPRRPDVLLGRRRRRPRWPARGRAPRRPRPPPGRVRRRPDLARPGARPARGRPRAPGPRPACRTTT